MNREEIILELARLQREALQAIHAHMAAKQHGEAFNDDSEDAAAGIGHVEGVQLLRRRTAK